MRFLCAAVFISCLAVNLGGCATLVSGTDQHIPVTTDPPGATVSVDGTSTYTTPTEIKLARRDNHTLLISRDGYHSWRVELKKEMNPAILGNILLGGVVGGVADYASGAAAQLKPDKVHVLLEPRGPGELAQVREWNPPKPKPAREQDDGIPPSTQPSKQRNDETYSPSRAGSA